jgi:hypothetical protein
VGAAASEQAAPVTMLAESAPVQNSATSQSGATRMIISTITVSGLIDGRTSIPANPTNMNIKVRIL